MRCARTAPLSLAALLLAACAQGSAGSSKSEPTPVLEDVRTVQAVRGVLHPALSLAGTIAPQQTVALSNTLAEPAANVYVQEGDRVHAGELLAQLDVDDLQAQLRAALETARSDEAHTAQTAYTAQLTFAQAPNQVRQAQSQLAQAQKTFREAQINRDRIRQLVSQGYLAQQNLDEQQVVVQNDEQAVVQADAQLQVAIANQRANGDATSGLQASTIAQARQEATAQYATADQIRREISRARIVSPVDGIVINRNLNPGEYPSGRQIFTIEANDVVYAVLTASAVQAYQIQTHDAAVVRIPGLPGARFSGSVAALLDSATPGSTNFTVKVLIPNRGGVLRAGTPVQATIALRPVSGPIVPSSAFADEERSRIAVIRDGRAHTLHVTEIATDGANSVVSGVAPGETVVRDGSQGLSENQQVATVR